MVAIRRRRPADPIEIVFKVFFVVMVLGLGSAFVAGPTALPDTTPAAAPADALSSGGPAATAPALRDPCLSVSGSATCPPPDAPAEPTRDDASGSDGHKHWGKQAKDRVKDVAEEPTERLKEGDEDGDERKEWVKDRSKTLDEERKTAQKRDGDDDDDEGDDD